MATLPVFPFLDAPPAAADDDGLRVVATTAELRDLLTPYRRAGALIGFVPTMGALHDGHLELVRRARVACDIVVVSIFVNPTQFGAGEDLDAYPRDLTGDCQLVESVGADIVFAPTVDEMYPGGVAAGVTWVSVDALTDGLCGRDRPGHFRGVTTVVARLFNKVQPDMAFFGEKDYQQLATIRRMVHELDFPIDIVGVPTVREADGLAMSSRNTYLTADERARATCLSRALRAAQLAWAAGTRRAEALLAAARTELDAVDGASVQYLELVEATSLAQLTGELPDATAPVMAMAVRFGATRLIDNARLDRSILR